jgi:hypothetical protein
MMPHLDNCDVVVREKHSPPSTVYLVGTRLAPGQFVCCDRDEANSRALSYAKAHQGRAWFHSCTDDFWLLGTFRKEEMAPARPSRR